ncbi:YdeI/OmpD-associated family protein [Flavobacteriaceae bacterium KMM 6897]|nr:YdeI/OmpD-associated family protein [Flavobacteriaceae bacterium KMM 6897]MEB8344892.1 YdeI/OmpD-associated family protein [Flavobacteriaceae bacterium KMM 6898]
MNPTFFKTPSEYRNWLETHHDNESELLVGYYKVKSNKPSITWSESVDVALCYGWIDGVRKSIDEERYCIRFTPRKADSIWSAVNISKMDDLIKSGRMTPKGLASFKLRKESKSRVYAYEKETLLLSKAYENKFKANKLAWKFFIAQAPSYQTKIINRIMSAKQDKTRLARLENAIIESANQKRLK